MTDLPVRDASLAPVPRGTEEPPVGMIDGVPDAERGSVRRWWAGLTAAEREEVAGLFDSRWDVCFFGPMADHPPEVIGGRFVPPEEASSPGEWEGDWREYLMEHPEVPTVSRFRTFEVHVMPHVGPYRHWTAWAEWDRIRVAPWLLPPSEVAARGE